MPLRLALLGFDADVVAIARAAYADPAFEVTILCDADPPTDDVRRLAPLARYEPHWESLLLGNEVEAVVVAQSFDRELRADQLRKLVQAGIGLLVMPPACEAIVGFELDMIRRDVQAVLVPYLPGGQHPAVLLLADFTRSHANSPLGRVEQLVFERTQSERGDPAVLAQLARDVGLARIIVGQLTKVSAMGGSAGAPSLANLGVHLSGPPEILVRWSVGPVEHQPLGKIVLLGSRGKAVLSMPPDERDWQLVVHQREPRSWPDANGPAAALQELALALSGSELHLAERDGFTEKPRLTWLDAGRDVEIAETAQRSILRGRTIELYQEEHSEQETFKGVMSVGGCVMLAAAVLGLLAAFVVGGIQMLLRDPDAKPEPSTWPLWLKLWPVYPLAIFLLLQLLQLVFKPAKRQSEPPSPNA